jgi:Holliday junction DNA helicase RuvA
MITYLHGKLIEALPTQVTVEVNGMGYEALIPLSSYDKLPAPGQPVKLLTTWLCARMRMFFMDS